jgi:hypothetical protein
MSNSPKAVRKVGDNLDYFLQAQKEINPVYSGEKQHWRKSAAYEPRHRPHPVDPVTVGSPPHRQDPISRDDTLDRKWNSAVDMAEDANRYVGGSCVVCNQGR